MILHELVTSWRKFAELCARKSDTQAYAACADELESALADGGEAVAWMDNMGGVITAAMKAADPGRPYNTPLFTHPAGAVQVTDEMALRLDDYLQNEHGIALGKQAATAAVRAALNPGGSRD